MRCHDFSALTDGDPKLTMSCTSMHMYSVGYIVEVPPRSSHVDLSFESQVGPDDFYYTCDLAMFDQIMGRECYQENVCKCLPLIIAHWIGLSCLSYGDFCKASNVMYTNAHTFCWLHLLFKAICNLHALFFMLYFSSGVGC